MLTPEKVIEFGNQWISSILPEGFDGRLFLAGGCFKSLISKKSPRDLDIWPATENDSKRLIEELQKQGNVLVENREHTTQLYNSSLQIDVEVIKKFPGSLKDIYKDSDLELSCIGVEYDHGEVVNSLISPGAYIGVQEKAVYIRQPWRKYPFNLLTLNRLKKYAQELDYTIPEISLKRVWQVYIDGDSNYRRTLLENANLEEVSIPSWVRDSIDKIEKSLSTVG